MKIIEKTPVQGGIEQVVTNGMGFSDFLCDDGTRMDIYEVKREDRYWTDSSIDVQSKLGIMEFLTTAYENERNSIKEYLHSLFLKKFILTEEQSREHLYT